jgi:hypothetical protein
MSKRATELDEFGEPKGWFKQAPDCDYKEGGYFDAEDGECHPDATRCCNPCLSLNGYDVISYEEWEKIRQRREEE